MKEHKSTRPNPDNRSDNVARIQKNIDMTTLCVLFTCDHLPKMANTHFLYSGYAPRASAQQGQP